MEAWLLLTLKTNFFCNRGDEFDKSLLARHDYRQRIRRTDVDDEKTTKEINNYTVYEGQYQGKS